MAVAAPLDPAKFRDPALTARGERRARVAPTTLDTLWFNTGTLCNVTCQNCYIESSPRNDRLAYLSAADVALYLDEIERDGLGTREIGFTGGEPFMNPEMPAMLTEALGRGYRVLVLTNAMRPMMRRTEALTALRREHAARLIMRVSLDHHTKEGHEAMRGPRTWEPALGGLRWLVTNGFTVRVASRQPVDESEGDARAGFARLFAHIGVPVDARDPGALVLFPEMDAKLDVPEITERCWGILKRDPASVMCASSRMVVKRKGAPRPTVVACTLLPYEAEFELGASLADALRPVALNHPHCARFCVLGGASCGRAPVA
ncbi:MAG: radical SAM protein [Alphaproteobacteria bacterium]